MAPGSSGRASAPAPLLGPWPRTSCSWQAACVQRGGGSRGKCARFLLTLGVRSGWLWELLGALQLVCTAGSGQVAGVLFLPFPIHPVQNQLQRAGTGAPRVPAEPVLEATFSRGWGCRSHSVRRWGPEPCEREETRPLSIALGCVRENEPARKSSLLLL